MPRASSHGEYYAVRVGRRPGVYRSWGECKEMTSGYPGAVFKKFKHLAQAEAFAGLYPSTPTTTRPESRSGVGSHGRVKPFSQISWDLEVSPPQPAGETADEIIVYTDGASSKNGQVGAKAGVGVYFGYLDPRNVSEPLAGNRQTNQRAELTAIVRALEKVMEHEEKPLETGSAALSGGLVKRIVVYTDSMYSINCLTKWYRKWENNGWIRKEKGTVENADLIQRALVLIRQRNGRVRFIHVKGHRGIEGNERADELAVRGCMLSEH
ncbi:hypothetical protein GQ54DRAFT_261703 [Martensiomyces pterosporus]|nr:hypothetical protein GQ54DRAFT_261703 [Martensiomyces pterosporus]